MYTFNYVKLFRKLSPIFIYVFLFFSVDPQIEVRNQVVGAPVGTEIILRCSIQASPKPMTFWMRKEGKNDVI